MPSILRLASYMTPPRCRIRYFVLSMATTPVSISQKVKEDCSWCSLAFLRHDFNEQQSSAHSHADRSEFFVYGLQMYATYFCFERTSVYMQLPWFL